MNSDVTFKRYHKIHETSPVDCSLSSSSNELVNAFYFSLFTSAVVFSSEIFCACYEKFNIFIGFARREMHKPTIINLSMMLSSFIVVFLLSLRLRNVERRCDEALTTHNIFNEIIFVSSQSSYNKRERKLEHQIPSAAFYRLSLKKSV